MNKDSKLIWEAYTKSLVVEDAPVQPDTKKTNTVLDKFARVTPVIST